jgi:hypothetical protein
MTTNWPPNLEIAIRRIVGAPVQTDMARSVTVRPQLGTPFAVIENNAPAAERVLSKREIARALGRYRRDPEFRGERRVPLAAVASICGLSRQAIYRAECGIMGDETTQIILSKVIRQIENDEIRFRRVGREWLVDYRRPPAVLPPAQYKLVPAADWQEWAPCRNCGGHKWAAVIMNGAPHHACQNCLPPPQWAGMGIQQARSQRRPSASWVIGPIGGQRVL